MADATPLMLVTNAGLAAASLATPTGPFINIVEFRVGDAFGYTPTRNDTGLNGNLLYTGAPTQFRNVGNNTIDIVCQIPPDAGPFQYGEVGIYNEDSGGNKVLFAKAVFDTPQTKYSALGTNIATAETFHCLIKLEQSIAIFQFSTITNQDLIEYDLWSDVVPPGLSANPGIPLALVRELDGARCSSLLTKSDDTKWTVGTNYPWFKNTTVVNATTTSVTVPGADFIATNVTSVNRKYVLEFADGTFRSCSNMVVSGGNYLFNLNPAPLTSLPAVGSALRVYESINYKTIPLATNTVEGIVKAGSGIDVPTPGTFQAAGLLHSGNTGRLLTSSDNLNNLALISGLYHCYGASLPANVPPVTVGGLVYTVNTGGLVTQQYWPQKLVPSDPITPYWRFYDSGVGGGTWGPWSQMGGGVGSSGTLVFKTNVNNGSFSEVATKVTSYTITNRRGESHIYIYIGGTMVMMDDGEGGGGLSITVPIGTSITLSHSGRSESCPIYALEWS